MADLDRRAALCSGIVAIGSLALACGGADGPVQVGAVTEFPLGTWRLVSGPVVVGHDANGLFAYTAICTHAGCTIGAPNASGASTCPCHGSGYDGNGAVTRGPAPASLEHFDVTVANGQVTVDRSKVVAASTRTPV